MVLADLMSPEERAAVRREIASAETLPNRAFTSEAWFDLEVDVIYRQSWVALAFEPEVGRPGDVLPRDLARIPLVLVRGQDGVLRGFHNICPYDGCPVALEPQSNRTVIRAPYHGWRYDLEGRLTAAPYWNGFAKDDRAALGGRPADLAPIHVATYLGVVFVSLAEEPPPFEEYIAPARRMMEPWALEVMRPGLPSQSGTGPVFSYEVAGNWKTLYENTNVNVLHEGFTHALYDRSPEVPRARNGQKTYKDLLDQHLVALTYREADFPETYPALGVPHMGRSNAPELGYFAALFPNLHLAIASDWFGPLIALPDSADHTTVHEMFFLHPDGATQQQYRTAREVLYYTLRIAHMEDTRIIEGIQRGRHSPAANRKYFAPFWDAMHHRFNQMVLDVLEAGKPWPAMTGKT
jgi:choline monooxygenase